MQGPGHFRCTQSIFDAGMESKTLPGQKQHELFFFFFTKLSDFLLCIKSCVIIQPLCHEFFIVAAFCLNAKWSTAAWPVCFSPSGLLYVCLVCLYFLKHTYYLSCGYYIPLKRGCTPVAISDSCASAESREAELGCAEE